MDVGVTGHQDRKGIRWPWVEDVVRAELKKLQDVRQALSCLAAGTDQIFAEVAIELHIPVVAVVPLAQYETFFEQGALSNYQRLLSQCQVIPLGWKGDPERAFFEAGKFIVDQCDTLFAVWDGGGAEGLGGTGDVVSYAQRKRKPVIHINPCTKIVSTI